MQSVVNDLQVVARAEQAAVQARDDELAQAVGEVKEAAESAVEQVQDKAEQVAEKVKNA